MTPAMPPMNLKCLRCLHQEVKLTMTSRPVFKCDKCGDGVAPEIARALLDELVQTWEPVLKWMQSCPALVPEAKPVSDGRTLPM
jgi:hypothetical protein